MPASGVDKPSCLQEAVLPRDFAIAAQEGILPMPKVQLPHDPDLTRDRLKRVLEAELGSKYEIRDRGEKRLVIKSSDWYGVVVGITQKPNKGETTVAVGRLIPEFKNILMLLPLLLIALVPLSLIHI